jgi:hypothetical protein
LGWGEALLFKQQSAYGEMLKRKLEHEVCEVFIMELGVVGVRKDGSLYKMTTLSDQHFKPLHQFTN